MGSRAGNRTVVMAVAVPQDDEVEKTESGWACSKHHWGTTMEYYAGIDVSLESARRVRCGRDRTDRARGEGGQRARDPDRMVPQPEVRSDADWARSRTAVAVAVCRHAGCGIGRRVARDPARPGRIQGNAGQDRSKGCAWHRPADAARLVPCGALQIAPSAGSPSAAGSPQAAADQEP